MQQHDLIQILVLISAIGAALAVVRQWIVNPILSIGSTISNQLEEHGEDHDYLEELPGWTSVVTAQLNIDREARGLSPLPLAPVHPLQQRPRAARKRMENP